MKKALIDLKGENFLPGDFAKAITLARFHEKFLCSDGIPITDTDILFCRAVFSDYIDTLKYYMDILEE